MKKQITLFMMIFIPSVLAGCTGMSLYEKLTIDKTPVSEESIRVTWLGTAGIFMTDGKTGILIDPYVSRFGMTRVALGLPLNPDRELIKKWAEKIGKDRITAVIVSHSHFDHVADAPYFALEADVPLIGTESTINVGRGAGMTERKLIAVKPEQTIQIGDFSVKFLESIHGPALFGRVPYQGTIDKPLVPPAKAGDYRLGGVFSLLITHPFGTIIHHGSAGFKPGMYDDIRADVLLLGIAGRGDTTQYLENVVLKTKAPLVIPIHTDNFFKPLEDGMSLLPVLKFGEFYDQAEKYKNQFTLRTLPLGEEVVIMQVDPPVTNSCTSETCGGEK
jgi:L-ascorbate metabolism protein UlaG (beta-lactamase superfamily)